MLHIRGVWVRHNELYFCPSRQGSNIIGGELNFMLSVISMLLKKRRSHCVFSVREMTRRLNVYEGRQMILERMQILYIPYSRDHIVSKKTFYNKIDFFFANGFPVRGRHFDF